MSTESSPFIEANEFPEGLDPQKKEKNELLAPWAGQKNLLSLLEFPLRLSFFVIGPVFFVACSLMLLKRVELVLLMFAILICTSFLGSVQTLLRHTQQLEKIPILGNVLNLFLHFHCYYYENKPRSFFFYLFYPILAPLFFLFSASVRKEMKLYIKVIFTILFLILLETLLSYKDLYPPYLDWENALMIIFIQTLLAFFLILSFLMPVVTTSFTLSLSGKTFSLRLLNFVALLISVPTAIYFYIDSGSASFISSQLLTERLTKQNFRDDFRESSDVFLNYYHPRLPQTEEGFLELPELTLKYQRQINGITKAEESDFFKVFGVLESLETPDPQRRWLGIYMEISPKKELFYLYSPEGVLYDDQEALPDSIRSTLESLSFFTTTSLIKNR